MLRGTCTSLLYQAGSPKHLILHYLFKNNRLARRWCPGKDSDLQVIDRTPLRSNCDGGPRHAWRIKKKPGLLRRPGESHAGTTLLYASHQLSSVGRTYRRSIFGEGIRRQTRRNGYHLREIWSRLPSGSCRKVHDLSTTRPLSGWEGSALIQLGSFAQAVWLPCPETQAAVCCRAAAFGTPKHQQRSIIFRQACQGANLV